MNVIALGLANGTIAATDFPLRDAFVFGFLFGGVALLLVAGYLLFAHCAPSAIPSDPIRADD